MMENWNGKRMCVWMCLNTWNAETVPCVILQEAYVQKMVKVCNDSDRWSLISLSNNRGKNVELKFVDSLRRQFEFSVDSFQIKLDSLLLFYECSENPMAKTFHPTIIGESVYGDFATALDHLRNKVICTRNPEEIRGGGLLKYCHLLVRDFRAASESEMKSLQRYMCSRFFIDFSDISEQQRKLESYLQNHFVGLEDRKYDYLTTLHGVVNESTVCLMGHERRQALGLIAMLAVQVLAEQNVIPNVANVTCYYQPAPYVADGNFSNYYIAQVQPIFTCHQQTYSTWLPCNWTPKGWVESLRLWICFAIDPECYRPLPQCEWNEWGLSVISNEFVRQLLLCHA